MTTLSTLVFEQWHDFFSYVLSFLVIGYYWVLHRRIFIHVEAHDKRVVGYNLLFLLVVAKFESEQEDVPPASSPPI